MSVHAARYLRTLAMSPRSTANRYRFSSFVKGFGRLVMIRLFGLPIPGTGDGTEDSTCVIRTNTQFSMSTLIQQVMGGIQANGNTHPFRIHYAGGSTSLARLRVSVRWTSRRPPLVLRIDGIISIKSDCPICHQAHALCTFHIFCDRTFDELFTELPNISTAATDHRPSHTS